jgi:hypothetical protein
MPISTVVPLKANSLQNETSVTWQLKAAGTYDLVAIDPQTQKRCAKRIVSLAADTWTIEDQNGTSQTVAVPANFVHIGATRGITCAQPIAVYW